MWSFLQFLFIFFHITIIGGTTLREWTLRKDFTFYSLANGWVKLHRSPEIWSKARLRCHFEGSVLASPLTHELQTTMQAVLGQKAHSIFTGISSTIDNGEYFSVEGIPFDDIPTNWVPSEPGLQQCIAMFNNGTMTDVSCDQPRPFICYKKYSQNMRNSNFNRCGTDDPEYVYQEKTNHCYKVHNNGQNWIDAFSICALEGGYLAIINSDEEAKIFISLLEIHPPEAIMAVEKEIIGIGFHDWYNHNVWMTVHGETLQEAGYESWAEHQPDNNTVIWSLGEYCGGIDRAAKMHDVGCGYTIPFICEMDTIN